MSAPRWSAQFRVTLDDPEAAERLLAVLGPEASRDVPKASVGLARPSPNTVAIDVRTSEVGALRAAANTYLGWVDLAVGAASVARRAGERPPVPKPLSP